jgi:hypothetical protein
MIGGASIFANNNKDGEEFNRFGKKKTMKPTTPY